MTKEMSNAPPIKDEQKYGQGDGSIDLHEIDKSHRRRGLGTTSAFANASWLPERERHCPEPERHGGDSERQIGRVSNKQSHQNGFTV
ncbi:hypothetical protein [Erythrobacter sp. EC-HK427]|uniref:hypothetical protein n=1 Tax=Erythrobacter sp. EC-HK427 TaxID=2038396 RepID=UPI0030D93E66